MNNIKISAIMPVYNAERYIKKALDTLINQTLIDIEIICVDDGSTDNSINIIQEYLKKDDRIRLLLQKEQSKGAALARNMGIEEANGEYLTFVDADDFFETDMLEKSYQKVKETDSDVIMFDAWRYNDKTGVVMSFNSAMNERFLPDKNTFSPRDYPDSILRMTHGAPWGRLYRKSFVLEKGINFYGAMFWDDIVFTYVSLCSANSITILKERFLYYRTDIEGSQTSTKNMYPEAGYDAPLHLKEEFVKRNLYEHYKKGVVNNCLGRAITILRSLTRFDDFSELFFKLKDRCLAEMGAFDIEDEDFYAESYLRIRNMIRDIDKPEEFLIGLQHLNDGAFDKRDIVLARLQNCQGSDVRLVLYGAGVRGRSLMSHLQLIRGFKTVGWVDIRYQELGYPVQNPEIIQSIDFDYVVITLERQEIISSIKKYVMGMGVPAEKVIWIYEEA